MVVMEAVIVMPTEVKVLLRVCMRGVSRRMYGVIASESEMIGVGVMTLTRERIENSVAMRMHSSSVDMFQLMLCGLGGSAGSVQDPLLGQLLQQQKFLLLGFLGAGLTLTSVLSVCVHRTVETRVARMARMIVSRQRSEGCCCAIARWQCQCIINCIDWFGKLGAL